MEFVIKLGTQYLEVFDALWLQDSNNKQKEIEECRIMDKPLVEANDEKVHEDIERISLFDEEN